MKASIIILTKNAGKNFKVLLERIKSQKYSNFEIFVIDSGSTDSTVDTAREFGVRVHSIAPEDFHHGSTRNLGAELAKGDYLVYITQDATPLNDAWLGNLISPLRDDIIAGVYGRQIAYTDASPIEKFFYSYFYPDKEILKKHDEGINDFYISNAFVSDVNAVIKKDIWKKIKFDETIIMAEDKKWAIDVLRSGYQLKYEPTAAVYHSHDYSLISSFKRRFDDGVAMKQIFGKGNSSASIGFDYLSKQIIHLAKYSPFSILYALIYDLSVFTGLSLGKKENLIPTGLKKRMSRHSEWWN